MTDNARPLQFVPISATRAFEDIVAQIRARVASGRLKPGDRLPAERDLCAEFNVSRNTLREAFRALELSGIVAMRKGAAGGAFVLPGKSDVVVNGMRDLYHLGAITPAELTEARIWLSEIVVRVACERLTEAGLQELEANVAAAAAAHKADDDKARAMLHADFNMILARATRNPVIQITMEGVMGILSRFTEVIGPQKNNYTLPSRRRLLKQLRERDADAAVAEMTKLLKRLHNEYLNLWKMQEEAASPSDGA